MGSTLISSTLISTRFFLQLEESKETGPREINDNRSKSKVIVVLLGCLDFAFNNQKDNDAQTLDHKIAAEGKALRIELETAHAVNKVAIS